MGKPAMIRSVIEQFFHAMGTQDYDLMDSLIPKESNRVHIGTGISEIWEGRDVLMQATRE